MATELDGAWWVGAALRSDSTSAWLLLALAAGASAGCTTARRATDLVIDHHVGMARGAVDLVTGEAEAREQRLARLHADLEASRKALDAEGDPGRRVELLERHVALQDALITELQAMPGHADSAMGHGTSEPAHEEPASAADDEEAAGR